MESRSFFYRGSIFYALEVWTEIWSGFCWPIIYHLKKSSFMDDILMYSSRGRLQSLSNLSFSNLGEQ